MSRTIGRVIVAIFAILIGLYPAAYFLADMTQGLMSTKAAELLDYPVWNIAFKLHIAFGGLALLIGWLQFSHKLRLAKPQLHRNIGKAYVLSVLLSGVSGFYIAWFATGGLVAALGFATLAAYWVFATINALLSIRKGRLECHRNWMFRSYALTFAAVTLRIWLPLLDFGMGMEFIDAYIIVAWLCWVPNVIFSEFYIRKYPPQFGQS